MTTPQPESIEQARQRYHAAAHGMQSGVAAKMNVDPAETTPKHLRVGVNSAMVDTSAMATLLIAKGVITEQEYVAAVADAMEREKALYEQWAREHFGNPGVTLR
jgi:hypothetical protein